MRREVPGDHADEDSSAFINALSQRMRAMDKFARGEISKAELDESEKTYCAVVYGEPVADIDLTGVSERPIPLGPRVGAAAISLANGEDH